LSLIFLLKSNNEARATYKPASDRVCCQRLPVLSLLLSHTNKSWKSAEFIIWNRSKKDVLSQGIRAMPL